LFRSRRGKIRADLSKDEGELLRRLIREYLELLESREDRDRYVLARLFPSGSMEDSDVEREYRQLTQIDLDRRKRSNAEMASRSLTSRGPVRATLTDEESQAWLELLTDLRLAIGVRLGVTEEIMSAEPDLNEPTHWPLAVLHYLGMLQESLVRVLRP
jgi:hypothetical protein